MNPSTKRIPAALRQRVAEAAHFRCGYCLTAQRIVGPLLEIDHIVPQARGGPHDEDNLFLACPMCNSHKADRIEAVDPEGAATVPLFNPRTQVWAEHFIWSEDGTLVIGQTPIGRATVATLSLNSELRVRARAIWVEAGWHPP